MTNHADQAKYKKPIAEGEGLRRATAAAKASGGEQLSKKEKADLNANTLAARMQKSGEKKVAEGRYPSKQTPAMKALADKAEQDAAKERAKTKKKVMKKNTNESKAVTGLAFLVESELEKAQVVIAAKSILDKLQKMAEDVAKVEADDIMPMLDSMRLTFGPELTDSFNDVTTAKLRQTTESIKDAKEAITREVGRLENNVNGEETNDMGMDDLGDDSLGGDLGDDEGLGDGDMGDDVSADGGPELDLDGEDEDETSPSDDLDAAFDAAASDNAAGRARKESIQRNIKALTESANPDRLVFETFRRTLKEAKDAVRAARAVADAFAIDFNDVVTIVKEGKTYKDEKDKTNKDKDRSQDRKTKKRERPSDLDESVKSQSEALKLDSGSSAQGRGFYVEPKGKKFGVYGAQSGYCYGVGETRNEASELYDDLVKKYGKAIEEGKTFKDEREKTNKNKDRSEDRRTKKRERPSDIDEAKKPDADKDGIPDWADKNPKKAGGADDRKLDEFQMKPTPASKKGMFKGKTKEELHSMMTSVKKQMKAHEDKGEKVPDALRSKFSEITFALRAKNDWGKANESKLDEFEMKPTPASKRGMFKGKTKEELHSMLSNVKDQMKSHENKGEKVPATLRSKFSEITFALRAKNDWGTAESVKEAAKSNNPFDKHQRAIALKTLKLSDAGADILGGMTKKEAREFLKNKCGYSDAKIAKLEEGFKTGGVVEGARDATAATRQLTNESVSDTRKAELKKAGYVVLPVTTDASQVHTAKWFWKKDQPGSDTFVDHIQNGTSDSEDAAWADLDKHAKVSVRENSYFRKDEPIQTFSGNNSLENARKARDELIAKGEDAFLERGPGRGSYTLCVKPKKKEVEEAVIDVFTSREKAIARAKAERAAKGFGAMADAKKKNIPVKENCEEVASFDGPDGLEQARGLRDVLRDKGHNVFMERDGTTYSVFKTPVEESDGAKVLVMKHHDGTTPKQRPFSRPVKVETPKKK